MINNAAAASHILGLALADQNAPTSPASGNDEILIVVFLRGGWDALNVVMPVQSASNDPDRFYYEQARPNIAVPISGAHAALNPLVTWIWLVTLLASAFGRTIEWRGRRYRV